jgi:hypothetical protein
MGTEEDRTEADLARRRRNEKLNELTAAHSKSTTAAVLYTLFYGPLGCLYTNPTSTAIALLICGMLAVLYWPAIAVVWLTCVAMAPFQVKAYNRKVRRNARYLV